MSRRPVSDSRCIYCLETKPGRAFNREHVIPEAFGKFEPALGCHDAPITLLDAVCFDCNDRFGKNLDRWLSRDSVLGLVRFSEGVKRPGEFRPPSRDAGLTITPTDRDLPPGTTLLLGHGDDGTFGFLVERKVGFAQREGAAYTYFSPDALPSPAEVRAQFGHHPAFDMPGLTREEVADVMQRLCFRYDITREVPVPQRADATIPIGRLQGRAIAKIAFNYLAAAKGPEVACGSEFDGLRAYIISGERTGPPFVSMGVAAIKVPDTSGNPRRGHFATLEGNDAGFLSIVSLFSATPFCVYLSRVRPDDLTRHEGHFYDLDTRKVERMQLPTASGIRVTPAPSGFGLRLDR